MKQYTIPKNLQNPEFRFVKLKEKIPFEKAWQKSGYKFDDENLLKHLSNNQNCGVIGGYGKLRIQDIDDKALADELIDKFNTFTVRTGSGGAHFYFISDLDTNFVLKNDMGEFRGKDYQVVAPNMKHPNGNFYKVERDVPIRNIEAKELLEVIKPHLRDKELEEHFGEKQRTMLNCSTGKLEPSDESRSAFEYRRVVALLREGKNKEEVFKAMENYSKWANGHSAYKELTYKKAADYVESLHIAKEEDEKIKVMDFKSLMDYEVEPVKWLIEDQIPKGEVGLLAGKRGEGKTWLALKQSLGLAAGKNVFGDEVSEKRKVMIIDEESGENVLANRLQLLAKADGIKSEQLDLISVSFTGLKLDQVGSNKHSQFEEIVEQFKPDLIIVDCLQRVCGFDIDKENALISELFTNTVRPMMNTYGMSWLFIHHLRKSQNGSQSSFSDPLDEIRGGSELVNYCRYVLGCSKPNNQTIAEDGSMMLVLKVLKMSNSNIPEPKVLMFKPDNADPEKSTEIKIDYHGKVEDVLANEKRAANAIKDFIFQKGLTEFKTSDITNKQAEREIGFKKTNISGGLKELLEQGWLEKPKQGHYIVIGKKPFASPEKSLEEQKKDLVKTEDDINDEIIEESLRKKKAKEASDKKASEEPPKDNPFCQKCNSPMVDNKCIGGCE